MANTSTTAIQRTCNEGGDGYSLKWTWSGWVKRTSIGGTTALFSQKKDGTNTASLFNLYFGGGDKLHWECTDSTNGVDSEFTTNQVFRDMNAWYHIMLVYDTANSTENDRLILYVNGLNVRDNGGFSSDNKAGSGFGTLWSSAMTHRVGKYRNSSGTDYYFDGLMSAVCLSFGYALAPSVFGETDATTGEWKAKASPSFTVGTQGYHLKFEDSANLDLDSGANALSFTTVGNLIQTQDCPDNVFSNMATPTWFDGTIANCGNTITTNSSVRWYQAGSLGVYKGKWYWEVKLLTLDEYALIGITADASPINTSASDWIMGSGVYDYAVYSGDGSTGGGNGHMYNNAGAAPGNAPGQFMGTFAQGDIITLALDCDNNTLKVGANGQWANGSNATNQTFANTTAKAITAVGSTSTRVYHPAGGDYGGTNVYQFNFGNGYFGTTAVSTAQSDDGAVGVFEYDVPAGYRALCTKNLNI